jgi:hypothetical protein
MRGYWTKLCLLLGLQLALGGVATAQTVPGATALEFAGVWKLSPRRQPTVSCGDGFCVGVGPLTEGDPTSGLFATGNTSVSPTAMAMATFSATGASYSEVTAEAFSYFEFMGPTGLGAGSIPANILVEFHSRATVDSTDPFAFAQANAGLLVLDNGSQVANDSGNVEFSVGCGFGQIGSLHSGGCGQPDFTGTVNYSFSPNVVYEMEVIAGGIAADADPNFSGPFISFGDTSPTASASADPTIFFDPGYTNPFGYRLVVSAGIVNPEVGPGPTSPVPEPSTWALLCLGAGGVALLRARRKTLAGRQTAG